MPKHCADNTSSNLFTDLWGPTFIFKIKTNLFDLHQSQTRVYHLSYVRLFSNHGIRVRCHISCDRLFSLRYRRICALCGNHLCVLCDGIRLFWILFCALSYGQIFHLSSLFSIRDVRPTLVLRRVRLF